MSLQLAWPLLSLQSLAVLAMIHEHPWINPDWKDDDIFLLSKIDADEWKARVASVVKCRWRGANPHNTSRPWALEVAGVKPITAE